MIWIVIALITILSLVTVSFVSSSSTYSSMPGAKMNLSVLGVGDLLSYSRDLKNGCKFQDKHDEVAKLVAIANVSYNERHNLEAASQALEQAIRHYEAIRKQANSAVVALNLAILAKARIKVEREKGASDGFIKELEEYYNQALEWAGCFLEQEDNRYDQEVNSRYEKLNPV